MLLSDVLCTGHSNHQASPPPAGSRGRSLYKGGGHTLSVLSARAANFLPHNTCCARACTTTTKSTRFFLTPHPGVNYHLSPLQVRSHMIAHPCQRQWPLHKTNGIL